ncbi:MAG: c-type cytochrome [Kofleriaceae bacterium]
MRVAIPVCITLVALTTLACGTDFVPPTDDPDQAADGEAVYRETCMQCHGDTGEGSVKGPQILSPVIPYATYVTEQGRGQEMGYADAMPAYAAELTSDEIAAVMAWLSRPAKPTDGAGLYTRFCGNCHGADAYGGRSGEDLTGEVDEADEVMEKVREGHGGASYGDRTKYMPSWQDGELTDAEVALITSYIASLPPNPNEGHDDDDDDDD